MNNVKKISKKNKKVVGGTAAHSHSQSQQSQSTNNRNQWDDFAKKKAKDTNLIGKDIDINPNKNSKEKKNAPLDTFDMVGTVTDPSHPSFERQDNIVYKAGGSLMYPNPEQVRKRRKKRQ